jgi:hypothetical protein
MTSMSCATAALQIAVPTNPLPPSTKIWIKQKRLQLGGKTSAGAFFLLCSPSSSSLCTCCQVGVSCRSNSFAKKQISVVHKQTLWICVTVLQCKIPSYAFVLQKIVMEICVSLSLSPSVIWLLQQHLEAQMCIAHLHQLNMHISSSSSCSPSNQTKPTNNPTFLLPVRALPFIIPKNTLAWAAKRILLQKKEFRQFILWSSKISSTNLGGGFLANEILFSTNYGWVLGSVI